MKVSVIVPFFNDGNYIDNCINSVKKQTHKDIEIIIVDNHSTDTQSLQKLEELDEDETLQIIYLGKNGGPSVARNIAIKAASGEYILPLDADDLISPTFIEKALFYIKRESVDVVYSEIICFGEHNFKPQRVEFNADLMLIDNQVVNCGLYQKSLWEKIGGYDETLRVGLEDWDFWLLVIGVGGQFYQIPERLFHYRLKKKSRNNSVTKQEDTEIREQIILKHSALYLKKLAFIIEFVTENFKKEKALQQELNYLKQFKDIFKLTLGNIRFKVSKK